MKFSEISPKSFFFSSKKQTMKPVKLHDFVMRPELRHYSRQRSGEVKRVPINLVNTKRNCWVWKIPVTLVVRFGRLTFSHRNLQGPNVLFSMMQDVAGSFTPKLITTLSQHQDPQTDARILIRQFLLTQGPHVSSHVTLWLVEGLLHLTASQKNLCFLVHLFPGDNPDGSLLGTMDFPLNSRTTSS